MVIEKAPFSNKLFFLHVSFTTKEIEFTNRFVMLTTLTSFTMSRFIDPHWNDKVEEEEEDLYQACVVEKTTGQEFKWYLEESSGMYDKDFWEHYRVKTDDLEYTIKSYIHLTILDKPYHDMDQSFKDNVFRDYWSVTIFPVPKNPDMFKALAYWLYYNEPSYVVLHHIMKQEVSDCFENHTISDKYYFIERKP